MTQARRVRRPRIVLLTVLGSLLSLAAPPPPAAHASHGSHVVQNNWDVWAAVTGSDGMRIHDVKYKGKTVMNSGITIPQVRVLYPDDHVVYDHFEDQLLFVGIQKENLGTTGFRLKARYCFSNLIGQPSDCVPSNTTYDYLQRFDFYSDGQLWVWLEIHGPGLMNHGGEPTYRIWWRMDFDVTGAGGDYIQRWNAGTWQQPSLESYWQDDGNNSPSGYEWRMLDPSPAVHVDPNSVDDALFYGLLFHTGEGDTNAASEIYPTNYINGEGIQNTDNVGWYRADRDHCNNFTVCIPGPRLTLSNF